MHSDSENSKDNLMKGYTKMKKTLVVNGMMCDHCKARVNDALAAVEGVDGVKIDLKKKIATVKSKLDISDETLIAAVKEAGFEAEMQ